MEPCCRTSVPPFADLLVAGAGWLLAGGTAWALLVLLAALLEAATDGHVGLTARLGCRGRLRLALLAGAAAVLALGAPCSATERPRPEGEAPAVAPPARPLGALSGRATRRVVVRAGDTLWRLSAVRHPHASPAELVRAVARDHRVNRSTIGPDPDLIRPGQRLLLADPRPARPAHRPAHRPSCPRSELP